MQNPPTLTRKRIELLDVYRGFAVFGIFVVNITIMNSTFLNQDEFARQWTSVPDQWSERILQLFFYTKFFPIFSLLFGLGISMQGLKWLEKQQPVFSFFARRMGALFLIGALHIILLWSGDVLHIYAILGLLVTFFLRRSNTLILALSIGCILFPFYDILLEWFFGLIHFRPESYLSDYTGGKVHQVITSGSYLQGVHLRVLEYLFNTPMLFGFLAPIAMSMFLVGLYLGKNKIYTTMNTFIARIKTPALLLAILSNGYRLLFLFYLTGTEVYKTELARTLFIKLMVLSDVVMGLFYLWLIGWLWYHTPWKKVLSPLQYAGRMALTNYLLQSVTGLFLFSSVGFKRYESFSPSQTLLIAILVFLFQVLFSRLWLSCFKFGPIEWIWRCLSYQKILPIKKEQAAEQ